MNLKKSVTLLVIFTFMILLLSGCKKEEQKELTKVRLNEVVRSIFYAPMYVAINEGFFAEEGLEIELSTGQGADKTMQQVLSKNADIGFCGPEQVIYLYNQGREDYGIVFAQLTKRDGSFLVSRNNEDDFAWENLKGKTIIGGRPGGVPEMTLEYVLRNHGLTPNKDVNIITNIAFTATAQAFKSGTGDYVALFEPTASMLEKENGGYVVASVGKASGEIPYTCFFATKSYIEANPDIIQKFTNAIYKGMIWTETHSSTEIANSIKNFFPGSDIDVLIKVIERYKLQDTWAKTPIVNEDALYRLMDIIQSYNPNLIPKRPIYENIVTTEFAKKGIRKVIASAITFLKIFKSE